MDDVSKNNCKIMCSKCKGTGYMKQVVVVCNRCNGKICMYCEYKGGYSVKPYETCNNCYGYGEIYNNNL